MRFIPHCLSALLGLLLLPVVSSAPADDLTTIKQRLRARYLAEWAPGSAAMEVEVPEPVDGLLARLQPDGSWPDVDYHVPATVDQVGFPAFPHAARVRKLAAAYAVATGSRRITLRDAIHRALAYWIKTNPQTGHHWFVEIGAPIELGKTAVMFEEELTPEERAGVARLMEVSRRPDGTLYYATRPATGQNLIWEATLQIVAGCLLGEVDYVAHYARRAEQEIKPFGPEGIQVDWSFHQHGPQLSSAAYGVGFVNDCARLIAVLQNTAFQFQGATTAMIAGCVLDGDQWMIRGHTWDFSATARNIVWPRVDATEILPACDEMDGLGGPRSAEFQALARRLRGRAPAFSAPAGNRLFWTSDYMTHVRPGFYASVKMSSVRTFGNESGNGQGEKTNYHLGDGAVCFMVDGGEYRGVFPLWDWRRVPGVTCVYPDSPQSPLPANIWGKGSEGGGAFVGGASDSAFGVAAMELNRGGVTGHKAWFFLDGAVACLGAGIAAADGSSRVLTSVEQCWDRGDVQVAGRAGKLPGEAVLRLENPAWVFHHGVAYVFPEGGDVNVRRESKRASWQTINTLTKFPEPASGAVFSLWLEHGRGVQNGRYAYFILPGVDAAQIAPAVHSRQPKILANSPDLQAISSEADGVIQAVFWRAGQLRLPGNQALAADAPAAIQLSRNGTAGWRLTVGNPTQKPGAVHVLFSGAQSRPVRAGPLEFSFPAGAYAGQPITRLISR